MRVITGKARGVQLKTPDGMLTRPTTDRVKEALFSVIQFDIPGARVLDLFGGTGQLGIEALSRGAKKRRVRGRPGGRLQAYPRKPETHPSSGGRPGHSQRLSGLSFQMPGTI